MTPLRRELRGLAELALPVVVVQVGIMMMGTVDVMMLGRVSESALAAGALGSVIAYGHLLMGRGLLTALEPLVSQAFGARDHDRLARHFWRGIVVSSVIVVPLSLSMLLFAGNLDLLRQAPELQTLGDEYLRALVPGNFAFFLFVCMRLTLQGMRVIWPAVLTIVVSNLFNVLANWALIFGHLGFEPMGVRGSGLATSASRWVMALMIFALSTRYSLRWLRALDRRLLRRTAWLSFLRIGVPIAAQLSIEFYVWGAVAVMMGNLGPRELAAHQIAISLASLSFMVPLGIGAAAATRVGNAVGRGDSEAARRAGRVALASGATVMVFFSLLFAIFPHELARLFTDEPGAIAVAAVLIPIGAIFQIADGVQIVATGVLRGVADTRFPAFLTFVGFWLVGLPVGSYLTYARDLGPRGLWWGLTAGLTAVAVLLALRVRARLRGELQAIAHLEG